MEFVLQNVFNDIDKSGMMAFIEYSNNLLRKKSPHFSDHNKRVGKIAKMIARKMDLSDEQIRMAYKAGLMHDIGKIGIREDILNKPEKLTPDEFNEIKFHPILGFEILKYKEEFNEIALITRQHHEMFNGKGYPDGLVGNQIHLIARIVSVADSFDAMTKDRPYAKARDRKYVLSEMEKLRDKQWDGKVVDAFLSLYNNKELQ